MLKIGIIGAGITGLTATYQLIKQKYSVDIFEKADIPGGVIQTKSLNGFLTEYGPSTLQLNDSRILALLQELGIEKKIIENDPHGQERYIVKAGQLIALPRSPLSLIRTKLFSIKAKLRLLKELFIKKQNYDDESVAAFFSRRLGPEFLDYAIDPFVSGIYAGDPHKLSLRYSFPKAYELEAHYGSLIKGAIKKPKNPYKIKTKTISFTHGMQTLGKALAEKIDDKLHLAVSINAIKRTSEGTWVVYWTKNEQSFNKEFDKLILTLPAYNLNALNFEEAINIKLEALKKVEYAPIISVSHVFKKEAINHPLDGFGLLVPSKEKELDLLGILFTSSMFPTHVPEGYTTLRTFLGGSRHKDFMNLSDEEIQSKTLANLTKLLGLKENPMYTDIFKLEKAIPQYHLGYGEVLKEIETIESSLKGLHFMGNYRTGISLPNAILAGINVLDFIQA